MKLAENLYVYEWTNYFENNCNSFVIGGSVGRLAGYDAARGGQSRLEDLPERG